MKQKLLIICGPTGTGKTALGLTLAKKFSGEIISADSRQVYAGMDIGTGKDLPEGAKPIVDNPELPGYYEISGVSLWGYDLTDPKKEFSVSKYLKYSEKIIEDIGKRGKIPILVGGTGLYIKALIDGIPTALVPRNTSLRKTLKDKSVEDLFEMLAQIDPSRAASLNTSDKKNPRRLMRSIEIAQYSLKRGGVIPEAVKPKDWDALFIALAAPKDILAGRIEARVKARLKAGIEKEIEGLLNLGVKWSSQSMSSLGYKQWKDYFKSKGKSVSRQEAVIKWKRAEKGYAKRQMTWFKKDKRINWYDITQPLWQESVEKLVKKWYITRK